ncbi:MAG TPA: phenylalanine--tRNA ligase subunit beta, partial [Candidatus Limnocylindria bacterium]|nr:phenylalanine--tRNA ligase subunit beta [Candidatus Limnocylindria bacterium]
DGSQPLGSDLADLLGETVIDVDVKPNRGDALSMVGLAREIAAFTGGELRLPPVGVREDPGQIADGLASVAIEDSELCPRFTARYLDGVVNGPSPEWMQRRLAAAGMRPISAIVDVTNYVMHELGQPMHAYDAERVPDGRIVVRRARPGERLVTIDHVERELDAAMLVIADAERPIGLAGIMGGADTEVTASTTRVILESAAFHGPTVRNTARRLALRSEASARHEKGMPWTLPRLAADRAARLIVEIAGGRVASGIVDNDPAPKPRRTVSVDLGRTERLLGIRLDARGVEDLLRPLEFEVRPGGAPGAIEVTVPPHRLDVEQPADVAEEIARSHGYDRIPGRLPTPALPAYRTDPSGPRHRVRRILAGVGLDEVLTHALIGPGDLERSGYPATGEHLVRLANPISAAEHSVLRPVLYPSLLRALAENVRQRRSDAWLFDVGKIYWYNPGKPTPRERRSETAGTGRYESWEIGIVLLGAASPRTAEGAPLTADVAAVKGVVEALHAALGAPAPSYLPEADGERHPHRHPGRTARIVDASGRSYGSLGEVHPRVVAAWDLPGRPVDAAISLDHLLGLVPETAQLRPIPAAQPIDRDLAVILSEGKPVGELLRIVRQTAGPMLADVELFDVYRGPQVGEGRVSYALALRFQPAEAGDERGVEKALNRVRGALRHHLAAEIR